MLDTMFIHLNERLMKMVPNYQKKNKTLLQRQRPVFPDVS